MRPRPSHSPAYQLLAKQLKEARLHPPDGGEKLTQIEVATRLGKPRSFTFKVENAERELNALELVEYCEALGIDFFEFMRKVLKEASPLRKNLNPSEEQL